MPSGQAQQLSVTFTPTDTKDYTPVNATTTVKVALPKPTPPQVLSIIPVGSKKGLISFTVGYNEPLTAATASNPVLHHIFAAVTKLVKKHRETLFTKALPTRGVSSGTTGNTGDGQPGQTL